MLYVFGFQRTGVVLSDLYFVDPNPASGQEGAERGVRLEVRLLERGELKGSVYSAQPISIGRPVWRADLLESADGPPGSRDRMHYHPAITGWEPGRRVFDPELTADPVGWIAARLSSLETLLAEAGTGGQPVDAADAAELRRCLPEITSAAAGLLARVRAGELACPPAGEPVPSARASWL
ncbi:MAG: hypothetical protein J2P34_03690 [Actinobacteria bacterium]|nr:hypothetical protein [Actinomycetota bacterium]